MNKVFIVERALIFATGAIVPTILRVFAESKDADQFIRDETTKLQGLSRAVLVVSTPDGPQTVCEASTFLEVLGLTTVKFAKKEAEVHSSLIELLKPSIVAPGRA